jgi:hypothetical protein
MKIAEKTAKDTQNLEQQLQALRKAHPEIKKAREAMERALHETPTGERRPMEDKNRDGHK